MKAVTAAALLIAAGCLWAGAYFWEIPGRIRRYFSGEEAGFPRTRKKKRR
jgi:hypothetical protein